MKICRFNDDRLGVVQDNQVYDVTAVRDELLRGQRDDGWADPVIARLSELVKAIGDVRKLRDPVPLSSVRLLSPVKRGGNSTR